MGNLIIIETPLAEATMLDILQQANARHLHLITNQHGDIRLCSMIPSRWKPHRINIKPQGAAA
ncbi:hypothetical protein ACW4YW_15190 [Methylobacillus pratensis]